MNVSEEMVKPLRQALVAVLTNTSFTTYQKVEYVVAELDFLQGVKPLDSLRASEDDFQTEVMELLKDFVKSKPHPFEYTVYLLRNSLYSGKILSRDHFREVANFLVHNFVISSTYIDRQAEALYTECNKWVQYREDPAGSVRMIAAALDRAQGHMPSPATMASDTFMTDEFMPTIQGFMNTRFDPLYSGLFHFLFTSRRLYAPMYFDEKQTRILAEFIVDKTRVD